MSSQPPVIHLHSSADKNALQTKKPGFLKRAFDQACVYFQSLFQEERCTTHAGLLDEYVGYPLFSGGHLKPGTHILATYTEKKMPLNPFANPGESVSFLVDVSKDGSRMRFQHTGLNGNGLFLDLRKLGGDEYQIDAFGYSCDLVSYGRYPIDPARLGRFLGAIVPAINAMKLEAVKQAPPPAPGDRKHPHLRLVSRDFGA